MTKKHLKQSASIMALAIGLTAGAAHADPAVANLTLDFAAPAITVEASAFDSLGMSAQDNESAAISAYVPGAFIGILPTLDILGGANVTTVVVDNTILALEIANDVANSDPDASVDLVDGTGAGSDNGVGVAALQTNSGATTLSADIEDAEIAIYAQDYGTGGAPSLSRNTITADAFGNRSDIDASGAIAATFASDEIGQATLGVFLPADQVVASASYMATTAQQNVGLTLSGSSVEDARIGLLATVGVLTSIDNGALDVEDNSIQAAFTGNDSSTSVNVGTGAPDTLVGSAGVSNLQINVQTSVDGDYETSVTGATIEIGDSINDVSTPDIEGGTSVSFTGNDILASTTGNVASNQVVLGSGISQTGPAATVQENSVDLPSGGITSVEADLYVANSQFNEVDLTATVGDSLVTGTLLSVLVENVDGSSIDASDNSIGASVVANVAGNGIVGESGTSTDATAAISNQQFSSEVIAGAGDEEYSASNSGTMRVDVARVAGNSFTGGSINVDGNDLFAETTVNLQSSVIDVNNNSIDGSGASAGEIRGNRNDGTGSIDADYSILNSQAVADYSISSSVNTGIDVDITGEGGVGSEFTSDAASVSGNSIRARTVGNETVQNSITLEASNSINTTAATSSSQTTWDDATLSATVDGDSDMIDVTVEAETIAGATLHVDNNVVSASVVANLVSANTNALTVTSGGSVGDDGQEEAYALVNRTGGALMRGEVDAGFAVVNDQSVEDLDTGGITVSATADDSDFIYIEFGDDDSVAPHTMTDVTLTMDGNVASASGTFNEATSALSISAGTLDASAVLLNVQSVVDNENGSTDPTIAATMDVTLAGDFEAHINADGGDPTNVTASVSENELLASGRVNVARNSVSVVTENEQSVTGATSGAPSTNARLGGNSRATGEIVLLNDQQFEMVNVDVDIAEVDIELNVRADNVVDADEVLRSSTLDLVDNLIMGTAAGNDATNSMEVGFGSVDMSEAVTVGGPSNSPYATIASHQKALGDGQTGYLLSVSIDDPDTAAAIIVDIDDIDGGYDGVTVNATGNEIRGLARVNNVVNVLEVDGGNYYAPTTAEPLAVVNSLVVGLTVEDGGFVVASSQINEISAEVLIDEVEIGIEADGSPVSVSDSNFNVIGNAIIAEARSNDSVNQAGTISVPVDFGVNQAQITVANLQRIRTIVGQTVTIESYIDDSSIYIDHDADDSVSSSTDTLTDNVIGALASANRTANTVVTSGNNISGGSGQSVINNRVDGGAYINEVGADFSILNVQTVIPRDDGTIEVLAMVEDTNVELSSGDVSSYSADVDRNTIIAAATLNSASNTLGLDASTTIDDSGSAGVSAAIMSSQGVSDDVVLRADLDNVGVEINDLDPSSGGSAAISLADNTLLAVSTANDVSNRLNVDAGTLIDGDGYDGDATIDVGDIALEADFSIVTSQRSQSDSVVLIDTANIVVSMSPGLDTDSVNVGGNLISGQASQNIGVNELTVGAGSTVSDTTAQIGSVQRVTGDGITTRSEVLTTSIFATVDELTAGLALISGSSFSVSGNAIESEALTNSVINVLTVDAGANLLGSGLSNFSEGNYDSVNVMTLEDTDFAILNRQTTIDGFTSSIITGAGIGMELGLTATSTSVTGSNLDIDSNSIAGMAAANDAINVVALNSDAHSDATAAINNAQITENHDTTSTVLGTTIALIDLTASAIDDGTSLSVSGNEIVAGASSNVALNALSTTAGASFEDGSGAYGENSPGLLLSATDADYAVLNSQSNSDGLVEALVDGAYIGTSHLLADHEVTDSSFNVNNNVIVADAIGNDAVNSISLSSPNGARPSSVLNNLQTNTSMTISASVANATIGITSGPGGIISGSTMSVSGNTIGATAIGNRSSNSISGL